MSLFRKPKKIQRRIFSVDKEDEEHNYELQEEGNSNDAEKKSVDYDENTEMGNSTNKEKSAPKALLSFADDEDDAEVFQVRKSSHSKKMMRMLGKERRRRDRIGSKVHESMKTTDENGIQANNECMALKREFSRNSHMSKEYSSVGESNKNTKKLLLNEQSSSEKSNSTCKEIRTDDLVLVVKQVNTELVVLNGRAALCAGKNDLSDENDDSEGENGSYSGSHRFSKPEKIKEMLESGSIPDAAMIHAARKRRQKAREQGEFIPITEKDDLYQRNNNLKCEDDEEYNSENERIDMNDITGKKEQDERRQQFYSAEQNDSGDDSEHELHNWESQQLRKGVTAAQLINTQQGPLLARFIMKSDTQTSADAHKTLSTSTLLEKAYAKSTFDNSKHYFKDIQLKDNQIKANALQTPKEIRESLKNRLVKLKELNKRHTNEITVMKETIHELDEEEKNCTKKAPDVAKKYRFHQELKCYFADLIDCLNEKSPLIIDLEQRTLQIYSKRQNFLIERRRQDVRDQTKEIVGASANLRNENCEERIKRAAEREGRRTRRRCEREKRELGNSHLEGTSTDEEISDTLFEQFQLSLEKIENEIAVVCDDIVEDFHKINLILSKFFIWRETDSSTYRDSFVSLFLPKVLGPLVRLEIITWSPLSDKYREIEKMNWFSLCMLYAKTKDESIETLRNDPDAQLVPSIIEKIILPKLNDIVLQTWDPLSTRQTLRLIGFINRITRDFPLRENSKSFQQLFKIILEQMKNTLENDVFIPIFPKQIQEAKSSFFQRQFCSSLKLFRNYLSWQGIIADKYLIELTITLLLNRYMLLAMRVCSVNDAIVKACHIVNTFPSVWLQRDSETLNNLQVFTDFVKQLYEKCDPDSPLFMQSHDDARQILQKLHVF